MRNALTITALGAVLLTPSSASADIMNIFRRVFVGAEAEDQTAANDGNSSSPASPRLYWPSLESITGKPSDIVDGHLRWLPDFATEPAEIKLTELLLLEGPRPEKVAKSQAEWLVQLRNGDSLTADEITPTKEALTLKSPLFSTLTVPLSELHSLRSLTQKKDILFSGPAGVAGLKAPAFLPHVGGSIATRKWNANAELTMSLPDKVKIDFYVRSTRQPKMAFWIGASPTPRIETWGAEVVLFTQQGERSRFAPLFTLSGKADYIGLTYCYDKTTGTASVYGLDGALLGSVTEPPRDTSDKKIARNASPPTPGITIQNRGENLVIDRLNVFTWDGKPPAAMPSDKGYLTKQNGSIIGGTPSVTESGNFRIGDVEVPLADLREVVWLPDPPALKNDSRTANRVTWLDGNIVSGELTSLTDDAVGVRPSWTSAPVAFQRKGMHRIYFTGKPRPEPITEFASMDILKCGKNSMHGTLQGAAGQKEPRWLMTGARNAIALRKPSDGSVCQIERAKKDAPPPTGALVFLQSGEVIRAQVTSITEEFITLLSPAITRTELPSSIIRAIHWTSKVLEPKGFRDAGWRVYKGTSKLANFIKGDKPEADKVELQDGGVFGHPAAITGDDIRFKAEAKSGWGGVRMNLFVANPATPDAGSLPITLYFSGDDLYVMAGNDENQGVSDQQTLRNLAKAQADIRVSFVDNKVQVFANETKLADVAVEAKQRQGSGITFRAGAIWGNSPQGATVSNFSTVPKPGYIPMLTTPPDARKEALTVPRFRRDVLPAHLLVAPNGDLVRGRIEVATDKLIKFTSGLETVEVPRERVEAVIWPQKPVKTDPKLPNVKPPRVSSSNTHWLVLHDGSWLGLKVDEFGVTSVSGTSDTLGKCTLPLEKVAAVYWNDPPQTPAMKSHLDWQLEYAPEPVLPEAGGSASPMVGKAAPDFKLSLLGGKGDFSLSSAKGDVVVLDFWATWCGPCVASMPGTLKVIEEFKDKKVRFVAVNQGEQAAAVSRFIDQRKWRMTVAMDVLQEVAGKYGVEGIPHTVVVDAKGKIAWVSVGLSGDSEAKLREAISKALDVDKKP